MKICTVEGCENELPSNYSIKTEGYCYLCDPNVTVKELLGTQNKMNLKQLNWQGAILIFVLCGLGVLSNANTHSFFDWTFLTLLIGLPISIIILFVGKKP